MMFIPEIGKTYTQRGCALTVIMTRDDRALMEQRNDGKITQYIVASNFGLDGEDLYWRGSGKYFPCHFATDDTPYDVFLKAVDALRESVCIVIADTEESVWCEVCSNYDAAMYHLTEALNANADMVALAKELGCDPLTAETYTENKHRFDERADAFYWIDIDEIVHRKE